MIDPDDKEREEREKAREDFARVRVGEMEFNKQEMDFIFADWANWDEHIQWLTTAPKDEIADWIIGETSIGDDNG